MTAECENGGFVEDKIYDNCIVRVKSNPDSGEISVSFREKPTENLPMAYDARKCPECGFESYVYDTYGYGKTILRKRVCNECGTRWVTTERFTRLLEKKKT